ncbi:MAG: DUF4160 domain-containing protein [Vulcanimicrobiota bacterium]
MPTILRMGKYRFFFFSNEGNEPRHIHIDSGHYYAKYWLEPIRLARNIGFRPDELSEIREIINKNSKSIKEKWDEFFSC